MPVAGRASGPAWQPLEALARSDAVVAPLARLQSETLRAERDGGWAVSLPSFERRQPSEGEPLLHGQTLGVDAERLARLLLRLAETAMRSGTNRAAALKRALQARTLDVLALAEASITQHDDVFAQGGVDAALLATLTALATQPLLRACARSAASVLPQLRWDAGYCPLCAAWASLAEVRGLEQQRWLRCGRCAAEWRFDLQRCYHCGNRDFRTLGYLAPEAQREARRAATCDVCGSYLKTFTTIGALAPAELSLKDLSSVELDVAALERNYTRPSRPAFPLEVHLARS